MLMALNTRGYDHKRAYGLDNIIMDANLNQIARAKVDIHSVNSMTRFSYTPDKKINIETFKDVSVKENIITKGFNYNEDAIGVLFIGELSSNNVVDKTKAAELFPEVFNKLGHFKQFSLRLSSSS
jgi:hypothetical protein